MVPAAPTVAVTIPALAQQVVIQPTYTPRVTAAAGLPTATGQSNTATAAPTGTATNEPCLEPGQVLERRYFSAVARQEMGYRIYLPPCYGRLGAVYPALYLFHGNVHTAAKWDDLGVDEAAEVAIAASQIPPLLIVMPDGGRLANESSGGPYSFEGLILNDLIPHIEANFCAWPATAGRAIGGLSRGGYWALEIAFRHPQMFASVGGHSAALLDTHAGPELNPQFTGLANNLGDLRVYLDIGAEDYLRANILRLHEEMTTAGVTHTWHLNPGRHEDAYWAEHVTDYLVWYGQGWPSDLIRPACQIPPIEP